MIVTLTPNPSLDRTITVDRLQRGGVHRATRLHIDPGGKGVNVARALAAHGSSTVAVLPASGAMAVQFSQLLDDADVRHHLIDLAGAVRTNITVVEHDGTTTKINELGRDSSAADARLMVEAVAAHAATADWMVGCGSLPPGLPVTLYADVVAAARRWGVPVAIDTSGAALTAAVEARPDLIKPNHHELADLVGHELATLGDVVGAAEELVTAGIGTVVVSLGAQGAVAVNGTGAVHAHAPVTTVRSTVGAGDCLLAGWLYATSAGADSRDAIAHAVCWGSAAAGLPGSQVPTPDAVARLVATVTDDLDTTLPLPPE